MLEVELNELKNTDGLDAILERIKSNVRVFIFYFLNMTTLSECVPLLKVLL